MESLVFSIITVTYNASANLVNTIVSVINQTYSQIEYIIIDGNSIDRTVEIIEQYSSEISYWVSEQDKGLYDAMNKGLNVSTGDYVMFLNAGDTLKNTNRIAELATIAELNNIPDILYGETDLVGNGGVYLGPRRLKAPQQLTWKSFRMGMLVSHQAFIVKREIAPLYDLQYRFSSDFDWCIKCMKNATNIINIHLVLINYLNEGLTTTNRKASLYERYDIMCKYYGLFITLILHIWFAIRFYWAKMIKKTI